MYTCSDGTVFYERDEAIKYETESEYLSNRDPFSDVIENGSVQDMLERISCLNLVEFDEIEKEADFIRSVLGAVRGADRGAWGRGRGGDWARGDEGGPVPSEPGGA